MAPIPFITEEHVEVVLYLLNKGTAWRPQSQQKLRLKELLLPYVVQHCEITEFQYPVSQKEQQSINYLKASMITSIKINVQEHFMKMLLRYINFRMDIKGNKRNLFPNEFKNFCARLKFVKSILLLEEIPESLDDLNELESELLEEIWSLLIPYTEANSLIPYLVACDPLSFFPTYCALSLLYEQHGLKQFSAVPLRHSINQSLVRIDTVILYSHILELTRKETEEKVDMKYELSSQVFNLNNKAFQSRSGLSFEGSITTDGTSISIYLKHPEWIT
ncbi:hypothetical protein HK099_007506 [Clydaea vesicula]|uniref:Uncharacterized protein n=1 Tax=Clydaea vesicula TaxID=447962 RepID=A0AAD5TWG3_9FUNG|nr:hypothetical protein HK099_007506 [Clydaea vesicula]